MKHRNEKLEKWLDEHDAATVFESKINKKNTVIGYSARIGIPNVRTMILVVDYGENGCEAFIPATEKNDSDSEIAALNALGNSSATDALKNISMQPMANDWAREFAKEALSKLAVS